MSGGATLTHDGVLAAVVAVTTWGANYLTARAVRRDQVRSHDIERLETSMVRQLDQVRAGHRRIWASLNRLWFMFGQLSGSIPTPRAQELARQVRSDHWQDDDDAGPFP